ncbi:diguanylate cyclase [Vibrio sp. TH_r3]|uniref:sensor domain-containing diguanylate cyclase n=1 Tax=Vibrio sp. TH_r3 TaxID=3082084 RepID=UPI0029529F39|nr:diguanylate cyclase [Vibrio sp. TH_r3]MDV7104361.1 diguanylate cyclase [Vibrio sp. TH_r3]
MAKFIYKGFISTKSVVYIVSWLLLAMTTAIIFTLIVLLNSLDKQASSDLHERASLAISNESQTARRILEEYSYWDEAYQKIIVENDIEWIENNSGLYLMENNQFDFSLGVRNSNKPAYFIVSHDAKHLTFNDIMQNGLSELITSSAQLDRVTQTTDGIIRIDNTLFLVVGGPLIDENLDTPKAGTYIAIGKKIDPEYLATLSANFHLKDLTLSLNTAAENNKYILLSPLGEKIASLKWESHSPSKEILPIVAILLLIFTVMIVAITRYILNKDQENRLEYENKLFEEATTDPLTQIKNRRYFMDIGNRELKIQQHQRQSLSVLMLDLDKFKELNDSYGHRFGDEALVHFVNTCNSVLRESDVIGRIGGEEFAIILPDTNQYKAIEIANQIRSLIYKAPLYAQGNTVQITVSIGVAVLDKQECFADLLNHADKALYNAKNAGRNKVESY